MKHPFFNQAEQDTSLVNCIRFDLINLPKAYVPNGVPKAIVLGADPTNDGVPPNRRGIIEFEYVFGIGHRDENLFWGSQKRNLHAIGLSLEDVYVQNVCRNYFVDQTSKNKVWHSAATYWLPYLKEELKAIPENVPILATAEAIFKFLVKDVPTARLIYSWDQDFQFRSEALGREVLPLFRSPAYALGNSTFKYKQYLIERFNNNG